MEQSYNAHLAYLEFLNSQIKEELSELDIYEVENRLQQYNEGLLKLDGLKNMYVSECLNNDMEKNMTLDWVTQQKPVIKALSELKTNLEETLKGLQKTALQIELKKQKDREEEMSLFKERLEIDRAKRIAENEQKINALLQENMTNSVEERRKLETEHYEKISTISKGTSSGTLGNTKPQVKLQKLHMTSFDGNALDFQRFWPQFLTEIDQANINEVSKLNYMIELLKGKPKNDILGLPHNAEGYAEAKRILQEGYGKDTVVLKNLIMQLQYLPAIRNNQQRYEINEFSSKFSRIVRTLKTMQKLDSAEAFVHTTFNKLGPIKEDLTTNSEDWEQWGMEDLANNLKKYVDRNNLNLENFASESKFNKNSYRYSQAERPSEQYRDRKFDKNYSSDRNNQGKWHSENRNNQYDKSKMFYNQDNKTSENKNK